MSPLAGGRDGAVFRLDEAVADVFGDLRLAPVLRRLLTHTRRLTGSVAGSVSLVDAEHGSYVKVAEYGDFCHLGDTFPLDEGATGRAFGRRRPVVIPDYGRMRTNHLGGRHPGRKGPAAAVPIWWRGDVIAVNVAFTGQGGQFSTREVEDLEALTQTAAAAIIQSGRHGPSPAGEIRRRFTSNSAVVTGAGPDAEPAPFTPRETEVLDLLRQGLTDREIASRLVLSAKTVEKHVGAIMRKTKTTNRTAAVMAALEHDW
jgi:DNA-binding CsgD family transcriptional regulator